MDYKKLIEQSRENLIIHNNISLDKNTTGDIKNKFSTELLSDAMDDDSSSLPENIDEVPDNSDEDSDDFSELEGESDEAGQDDGDGGTEGDDFGDGESSDDSFSDSDTGMGEDTPPKQLSNNPLDTVNGMIKITTEFSSLEERIQKTLNQLKDSPYIRSSDLEGLENLLELVRKDKKAAALSPAATSLLRFRYSSELYNKELKRLIITIKKRKRKSVDKN